MGIWHIYQIFSYQVIGQKWVKTRMSKNRAYIQGMWAVNCTCAIAYDFSTSASVSAEEESSFPEQC